MRPVLVESHGSGSTGVDLRTATLDLCVPSLRGVGVRFAVEAADQFACQTRALLRRKAKDVGKYVSRFHALHLTRVCAAVTGR